MTQKWLSTCEFSRPVSALLQIRPMAMVPESRKTFGRLSVKKVLLSLMTYLGKQKSYHLNNNNVTYGF